MVESKAAVMGHPLHPMLIVFPSSLFPLALVFDVVWLVTGDVFWLSAAFWTVLVGVLLTAAAVLAGTVDYLTVVPKTGNARRTATWHAVLGSIILALAVLSLALRWFGGAYTFGTADASVALGLAYGAVAANALVSLLIIVQGWWGGELVYKHHIGVEHVPASQAKPTGVPGAEDDERPERRRGPVRGGGED